MRIHQYYLSVQSLGWKVRLSTLWFVSFVDRILNLYGYWLYQYRCPLYLCHLPPWQHAQWICLYCSEEEAQLIPAHGARAGLLDFRYRFYVGLNFWVWDKQHWISSRNCDFICTDISTAESWVRFVLHLWPLTWDLDRTRSSFSCARVECG